MCIRDSSGEGGFITTNDAEFMARCIMMSGSYMLYERHGAAPDPDVFKKIRLQTPNQSGRMDNLRAAILRPQINKLKSNIRRWNERYAIVEAKLRQVNNIVVPNRDEKELYVGSSIQFRIPNISEQQALDFIEDNWKLGVEIKWFGSDNPSGFTSNHKSWQYVERQQLDRSDLILSGLFDLRLPLTFSKQDCGLLADIISDCAEKVAIS